MRELFGKLASVLANEYLNISKLVVVLVVASISTLAFHAGLLDSFENVTLDQRFKLRAQQFTHPKVVLIEIAEDSIQSIGRWPWNREWHATIVKALHEFGVKAVAFDVLFSESTGAEGDQLFVQSVHDASNVYMSVAFPDAKKEKATGIIGAFDALRKEIRGEGHIMIEPDSDGLLRRIRPVIKHEEKNYYQLGFKMALDYYGAKESDIAFHPDRIEVRVPNNPLLQIPLTQDGQMLLNWAGKWDQSFTHVSFIDVVVSYAQILKGQKPRIPVHDIFDNSICIIGVTATGLFDIRAIPLEPAYPAVGINATVLNSMLERSFLRVVDAKTNLIILWAMSAILFLIMLRFNYLNGTLVIIALAIGYTVAAILLFILSNLVLNIVYPLALIVFGFTTLTTFHQVVISVEKHRLLKLATKDSMTGLYNIGHFKLLLSAELKSIKLRTKKDLSVIMVDVDFFKKINDSFGHQSGDEVLRAVADILRLSSRSLDVACRYGGEEFILMLPGASSENAEKVGEKLRKAIQDLKFELGEKKTPHPVTASFGVATYKGNESPDEFIKRADKALYHSKETGRNRVSLAP